MRVLIGLLIGLLLGAAGVFFTLPLLENRGNFTFSKSDPLQVTATNSFYVCTTQFVKETPLIIKSINGIAKTITFKWSAGNYVYDIEKTDDITYTAYVRREDGGFNVLALNRVTGALDYADHPANRAKELLNSMCERRITFKECEALIESLPGGRQGECLFVTSDYSCPRLNNLGLISETRLQCTPTDRRF